MPPHIPDERDGTDIDHLIDRSECGAWKDALKYVQFPVSEVRKDDRRGGVPPLPDASSPVSDFPHDKGVSMNDPLIQQARTVNGCPAIEQGQSLTRNQLRWQWLVIRLNCARRKMHRQWTRYLTRRGVGA